jgi:signal transduction histidine kinase/DNA-binding response OmpR family regulator
MSALSVVSPQDDVQPAAHDGALRVLLIEDNETDRWFFSEVLRSRGHLVVACSSGEDALETLDEAMPDLVLLDLQLPGIDGLEVCRRIRARDDGTLPFVILVTSTDEGDVLSDVLSAGADDFLKKPIEASTMVIRLDIAERRIRDGLSLRHAEIALRTQSLEMEALFNNIHDVFFSVDVTNDKLIQLSPATISLFGLSSDSMSKGGVWREYILPMDDAWTEAPDAANQVTHEYEVTTADGRRKWIRASVRFHKDSTTDAVRADGLLSDATEQVKSRSELAERNRELETLHDLAGLTLSAQSLEEAYSQMLELISNAMGCSVVAIEHLDRDRDKLVITAAKGIPAVDEGAVEIPLHRTLSGLAIRSNQPVLENDPGSRKEYSDETLLGLNLKSFAAFPLMVGGSANGTLLLGDVERVALDADFEKLGRSLATTVAAYVERLEAEEAIRESEGRYRALATELQQANQELESFAYSVSHDLRAPLRTMQGFAHALIQNFGSELSEEARDYAQRIIASGQQSEKLISDLLSYSRLSFERLELMPVELMAVVDQAREQVQGDLDESKAHLTVDEPLPAVRGNLTALVQVVANLLSNAVKFVPDDRKPEVRIRSEERGDNVRLWVEDNGVGVPTGQEERIFRVFERLAESGNRPGTGIGLAIVRRGMQRVGGDCGVERLPDGGSAFWIELPPHRRSSRSARRAR